MTVGLKADNLTVAYGERTILKALNLSIPEGRVTAILGPNGCGKSTLLRAFARLLKPRSGQATLNGADVQHMATRVLARQLGLLPQAPLAPDGITVAELISRGRAPWRGPLSSWSEVDEQARVQAMAATATTGLATRPVAELSGGQRQRVWIALVLAQQTRYLLLDEPTTWLDLPHQIDVLRLLQQLNRGQGTTVVSVLHDLNLAARYSDHLILLANQGLVMQGSPHEVLTAENLKKAFSLDATIMDDPVAGTPMVVPC